ncbi:MAG TPA: 5-formyltetrahydrofolate cyclo-ligase [Sedimentisphaerales bacterium]|nr:5-formyltetrahydrofolate cyclo-ligase [Sedimentisphaerales bacterium]HRS10686.1 5-formyltetrahydrofolate cyclo-ligase [Sedimentisphaerales bacterium]HRV47391.1 5-formyltetrahydrofolate cyclo-ligase [Sedimentisphaerales bacterium]
MDKVELRRQLLNRLLALSDEQRQDKSRRACRNLIATQRFQEASTIMMFLSLPHEVDTSDAILHAWQLGKTVAVPKISWQQRHMIPVGICSLETGFSTGALGLRNPVDGVPIPFDQIDLVVSPALGYDRRGNRLGRGAAFYDRFFANKTLTAARCGFAFIEQVVDSIPVTETDEPVDFLVTDEGVIGCDQQKGA